MNSAFHQPSPCPPPKKKTITPLSSHYTFVCLVFRSLEMSYQSINRPDEQTKANKVNSSWSSHFYPKIAAYFFAMIKLCSYRDCLIRPSSNAPILAFATRTIIPACFWSAFVFFSFFFMGRGEFNSSFQWPLLRFSMFGSVVKERKNNLLSWIQKY